MTTVLGMSAENLLGGLVLLVGAAALGVRAWIHSDDRRTLGIKWLGSAVFIGMGVGIACLHSIIFSLLYIIPAVLFAFLWLPNLGRFILRPLTDAFEGSSEEAERKPFYFKAEAKRTKGLYREAAAEVRAQLEQFPGDFEGMMKLATIEAEDLHDLAAGTETLNELLRQSALNPGYAVGALQTLADWQLNIGHDSAAARRSLQRIIELLPDTPASHTAEQRLAHLDGVTQAREFRERAVFKVPTRERVLGVLQSAPAPREESPEQDAETLAGEYVHQLQKYPNDTDTREKLAVLYADHLDRLDLAVSQLEQLAALTNTTQKQTAHWLDLLATLHIRHGNDIAAAENALRRVIDRFPKSALATRAVERLATLQGELKATANTPAAKSLGTYEKNLGLKSGPGV